MAASESQLIERYFRELGAHRADTVLGIGDDAALLRVAGDCELVLTTDALVEGVHFLAGAPARSLGHRALAVNLSDIAAMGASPSWALLSLNLPAADEAWLREFALGFGTLARGHEVALVGGNLSRGALSITVELAGLVPTGQALRRRGARERDDLYLSGSVGDAACGLKLLRGEALVPPAEAIYLRQRFEYPTPRVALGQALRGIASACIDVSDGVYVDATRLLAASGCGATVAIERLPLSQPLRLALGDQAWRAALSGGEDYELCFTAPPAQAAAIAAIAARTGQAVTHIGTLHSGTGLVLTTAGSVMQFSPSGFDHFGG
jgi:thiamine-monophosphate kinase